jgi:hypothetical protein
VGSKHWNNGFRRVVEENLILGIFSPIDTKDHSEFQKCDSLPSSWVAPRIAWSDVYVSLSIQFP